MKLQNLQEQKYDEIHEQIKSFNFNNTVSILEEIS